MNLPKKLTAAVLSVVILMCALFSGTVSAVSGPEKTDSAGTAVKGSTYTDRIISNERIAETGSYESMLEGCSILRYVEEDRFAASDPIYRLEELEDLNSYVFQNRDGSRTVYFMDEATKYTKNGRVVEKDISLISDREGYYTRSNNVSLSLSRDALSGVSLGRDDEEITLIPNGTNPDYATVRNDDDTVTYKNIYGDGIDVKYSPTLSGVKEDIILASYTGMHSFSFTLETKGKQVFCDGGRYYVAESADAVLKFDLGDIVAFDATGMPCKGSLAVEELQGGERYLVTVSVPEEFLAAESTVYPVTIDPTLQVSDNTSSGSILDCPVFSGYPNNNHGNYIYLSAGYVDSSFLVGRIQVKLPGLYNSQIYSSLNAGDITSVTFHCYDDSGNTAAYLNLYPNTSNASWTESNLTWNNKSTYTTSVNYGASVGPACWTTFNITNLVKAWKNGTYTAAAGFTLKNNNESSAAYRKAIFSSEYSGTTYRPYVSMTYNPGLSLNTDTLFLSPGSTYTLVAATRPSGQTVSWETTNTSNVTVTQSGVVKGVRGGGTATVIATYIDSSGTRHTAKCAVFVTYPEGVYKIKNVKTNYVLDVQNNGVNGSPSVLQFTSGSGVTFLNQMWKVKYLSEGWYSVRPMHNLVMGLSAAESSYALASSIGFTDTSASIADRAEWRITCLSSGNQIKLLNRGSQQYLTLTDDTVSSDNRVVSAADNSALRTRWLFEAVESVPQGVRIYETSSAGVFSQTAASRRYASPGTTRGHAWLRLKVVAFSAAVNTYSSQQWTSSNTSVATVNSSSGSVTAVSPGSTTITGVFSVNGTNYQLSFPLTVTELEDGIYFLQNKFSDLYADIPDASMTEGAQLHQWTFHGAKQQRWKFTLKYDGYYTIRSVNSGSVSYYMGVQGDSASYDVAVVLRSTDLADGTKWTVSKTSSGAYKLSAKSGGTGKALAVATLNAGQKGGLLQQRYYVNDDNYKDEWNLKRLSLTYVNYFDSTLVGDTKRLGYVTEANDFLRIVLSRLCDVSVTGKAPERYEGIADGCLPSTLPCTCYNDCEKHHKNIGKISDQLYNAGVAPKYRYVLWTNRISTAYCAKRNGVHTPMTGVLAVTVNYRPVIHFLTLNNARDDDLKAFMAITLLHETAHTFSMPEVYNVPGHDVANGFVCVMEVFEQEYALDFYQKILNGTAEPFCASCKTQFVSRVLNYIASAE